MRRHLVAGLLSAAVFQQPSFGQDDSDTAAAAEDQPEKITVTGSRIKRMDIEGSSPITIITKDDIDKSGATSVSDVMRGLSLSTANFAGGGSSVAGGVSSVSLRGAGASRTLVLVDGVKLPKHPDLGAVDLNSIPLAAIESIEILRQGAAAIYGADAIGGVVNVITKKNFDGSQINLEVKRPMKDGADSAKVDGTIGVVTDNSQHVLVLSYENTERLATNQRQFSRDRFSTLGYPGYYSVGEGADLLAYPTPGCSTYETSNGSVAPSASCPYNYNDHNTLLPAIDRFSALYNMSYDFGSDLTFKGKLLGTWQQSESQLRPDFYIGTVSQETIDGMSDERFASLFPGLVGNRPAADGVNVHMRLADVGNSTTKKEATLLGTDLRLQGYFNDIWQWEVAVNSSGTKTTSLTSPRIRAAEFDNLIAEAAILQWDPNKDSSRLFGEAISQSYYVEESYASGLEFQTNGEWGELGAGPVGLAIAVGANREDYAVAFDEESRDDKLINVAGSGGTGDRDIGFIAVEASLTPIADLTLNLALRHDNYSDFGASTNPLLSAGYQASDFLKLRGSWGTAFKAPTLDQLYGAPGVSFNQGVDLPYCRERGISDADCRADTVYANSQFKNQRGGNTELSAETSTVMNAGFVLQPLADLSLTADYWRIVSDDLIAFDGIQDTIEANDPNIVIRDADGKIDYFKFQPQNLAKQKLAGVDLSLSYAQRFSFLRLGFQSTGTWYVENKQQLEGEEEENELGLNGAFKWKLSNVVDAVIDDSFGLTVNSNTIGKHAKVSDDTQNLRQWTKYDLQARYLKLFNGSIALGVNNIFNDYGPEDDTVRRDIDSSYYDLVGREYYVRLSQNF